jgi:ankyrin repeat protein
MTFPSISMRRFKTAAILLLVVLVVLVGFFRRAHVDADRANTFMLLTAAASDFSAKHTEEAGFLFFAAQARFEIDKQVYPPVGPPSDGPDSLKSALSMGVGPAVSSALAADRDAFRNVAARLAKWSPKFDPGYDPGWKHGNALTGAAVTPIVSAAQKKVIDPIRGKATLLGLPEYQKLADEVAAATKVERAYLSEFERNHKLKSLPDGFREARTKHATAAQRMKEIELARDPGSRWYAKVGWRAEDYFDDPKVVALCHAIEENDVAEMERQISKGANVNAVGKDGMTPLLWAFPDGLIERFECLLKHDADPNVVIQSEFNTTSRPFHPFAIGGAVFDDRGCHPGQSVTLLAARSPVLDYLRLVLEHGGDAKQLDGKTGQAPLDIVIDRYFRADCAQRVNMLLKKGADVNRYCTWHMAYPVMKAANNDLYDVALLLLKAGADPLLYQPDGVSKLSLLLVRREHETQNFQPQLKKEFDAVVDWLEKHGETMDSARQEQSWIDEKYKKAFDPSSTGAVTKEIIRERQRRAVKPQN